MTKKPIKSRKKKSSVVTGKTNPHFHAANFNVKRCDDFKLESKRQKHAGGRPSKYDPAICAKAIEWGMLGKSREWICAELDIVVQTMANWQGKYPEFLEAMERAGLCAQQWWEDKGQKGMETPGFSAAIWSRSMAARFPTNWREKSVTVHEPPDTSHLTLEEIDALLVLMAKISAPKQG